MNRAERRKLGLTKGQQPKWQSPTSKPSARLKISLASESVLRPPENLGHSEIRTDLWWLQVVFANKAWALLHERPHREIECRSDLPSHLAGIIRAFERDGKIVFKYIVLNEPVLKEKGVEETLLTVFHENWEIDQPFQATDIDKVPKDYLMRNDGREAKIETLAEQDLDEFKCLLATLDPSSEPNKSIVRSLCDSLSVKSEARQSLTETTNESMDREKK